MPILKEFLDKSNMFSKELSKKFYYFYVRPVQTAFRDATGFQFQLHIGWLKFLPATAQVRTSHLGGVVTNSLSFFFNTVTFPENSTSIPALAIFLTDIGFSRNSAT